MRMVASIPTLCGCNKFCWICGVQPRYERTMLNRYRLLAIPEKPVPSPTQKSCCCCLSQPVALDACCLQWTDQSCSSVRCVFDLGSGMAHFGSSFLPFQFIYPPQNARHMASIALSHRDPRCPLSGSRTLCRCWCQRRSPSASHSDPRCATRHSSRGLGGSSACGRSTDTVPWTGAR